MDENKTNIIGILPRMLTLKEAAKMTPFSYYALRKMCLSGRVAHVRNSGKIYINVDSLARLMNGGQTIE